MTALFRLSGAGNDFLALPEPTEVPAAGRIRAWCRRGVSLGADGLFVLRRETPGEVRMDYFNADGGAAELCLNGTRCAARLAFHLGWAEEAVVVATGAGRLAARAAGGTRVRLALPAVVGRAEPFAVDLEGVRHTGLRVDVGVPHFVLARETSLAEVPVATLGAALRRHPAFGAAGTNVDFARYLGGAGVELRSFERGVEAETLACGTGVVAAAAAGLALGRAALPLFVLTAGGFRLAVDREEGATDPGSGWSLTGDARVVARLDASPEAEELAPPPAWSRDGV